MAKKQKIRIMSIWHRAVCSDDTFKGPWRLTRSEALTDAREHRSKRGNEDHEISIITEQTSGELL
jgi:hypothetical protein